MLQGYPQRFCGKPAKRVLGGLSQRPQEPEIWLCNGKNCSKLSKAVDLQVDMHRSDQGGQFDLYRYYPA